MKKIINDDDHWFTVDAETGEIKAIFDTYERSHKSFRDQYKNRVESDEEKLEKIDIKTIENFLRKKKLKNINK